MSNLQETRKKSITELVAKYKKLVDDTYDACSKELPVFLPLKNKDEEIVASAEEQLFTFIDVRNKALDNADRILFKINRLEIELNNPEMLENEKDENEEEGKPTNWTKKKAAETK